MGKVIAVTNQKGGVGKTVASSCLSVTLAEKGKKVLVIGFDPQGNLTKSLGYYNSNNYKYSLKDTLVDKINDIVMNCEDCIIHTTENIDCNPSLNLVTITALTASNSIVIPVQAEPFATDGLNDLFANHS